MDSAIKTKYRQDESRMRPAERKSRPDTPPGQSITY